MRPGATLLIGALLTLAQAEAALAEGCPGAATALGVSRVVEIDTSHGPLYGDMTKFTKEESFLAPKEVVLTFDDGPMPWITTSILDTLDQYCTKATFFSVGQMALAYPATVKDVVARGHTLGSHTWSHPMNIARLSLEKGKDQIERGMAAVALAAGTPIAPFFRFPGLSDSSVLLAHLQSRGIASFTVDVVSNDSYTGNAKRLTEYTLRQVEARQGGIILFHDIKASTAHALPAILAGLKERGYSIVHLRAKSTAVPVAELETELKPVLAKAEAEGGGKQHLLPFFGVAATMKTPSGDEPAVTELTPEARPRDPLPSEMHRRMASSEARSRGAASSEAKPRRSVASDQVEVKQSVTPKKRRYLRSANGARVGGWVGRKKQPAAQPEDQPKIFGF